MYRIPLPFTDAYLLLSPQWASLSRTAQVALLVLLILVPTGLVVWLYRYELRLVRCGVAVLLLLLRLVAVVDDAADGAVTRVLN
jgi:hypothetical protein